jgi:predicted HTH transcriptional regulator
LDLPDDPAELFQFDALTRSVSAREGKHREFKTDFITNNFSDYTKTLAAFANAGGGTIIFGVSDRPRRIVGVEEAIDEARWADRLREDFSPEIVIATRSYVVSDRTIFAISVDSSPQRPIICRRNRTKQFRDNNSQPRDIEVLREALSTIDTQARHAQLALPSLQLFLMNASGDA